MNGKDTISPNMTNEIARKERITELKTTRLHNMETMATISLLITMLDHNRPSDLPVWKVLQECKDKVGHINLVITDDLLGMLV